MTHIWVRAEGDSRAPGAGAELWMVPVLRSKTWNLNPYSCQGTCPLEGMIIAENSGCCQRLCFPATGQLCKAAASWGCTAAGGRWALKALGSRPLPTHPPKDGHSWAPTAQQAAETMHSCISAGEELVVTSGPSLCLRWGSKGRWSQFWCVLDVINLCPTPPAWLYFWVPSCFIQTPGFFHMHTMVSVSCRNPSAAFQCPHKSVNVLLFPADKGVFLY